MALGRGLDELMRDAARRDTLIGPSGPRLRAHASLLASIDPEDKSVRGTVIALREPIPREGTKIR